MGCVGCAIARGETETGVTTMQMDTGLDTGDTLLQKATEIGDEETAKLGEDLTQRLIRNLSRFTFIKPLSFRDVQDYQSSIRLLLRELP